MRSEEEMMKLILDTARRDKRIRAVVLNGSRADPNAKRDPFQDYDIVYLVTDIAPYADNLKWIQRFGEMMILQIPWDTPGLREWRFTYLMLFTDGNRIDLTILSLDHASEAFEGSRSVVLLDKDGIVPNQPCPSVEKYPPPTKEEYDRCCNEFWWVCTYVAKGLWRQELPYAKGMMDTWVRDQLMKMLAWYVGIKTEFTQSPGKMGRRIKEYLEPERMKQLIMTYPDAETEHIWDSLLVMGDMFRDVARQVGAHLGYAYPEGDDQRVTAHLWHVRLLPGNAKEIY